MKFVGRNNKNKNDCWCDAISLATGNSYDVVYQSLSIWKDLDGSLQTIIVDAILLSYGYTKIECSDLTVEEAINLYNSRDNQVLIVIENHVFYIHKGKIYDNKKLMYNQKLFEQKVECVFWKKLDTDWKHK